MRELAWAQKRWLEPAGHVLPVMVEPTDLDRIPDYLANLTILFPHGNVEAEVSAAISGMPAIKSWSAAISIVSNAAVIVSLATMGVGLSVSIRALLRSVELPSGLFQMQHMARRLWLPLTAVALSLTTIRTAIEYAAAVKLIRSKPRADNQLTPNQLQ